MPSLVGWLSWMCEPFVLTMYQPSALSFFKMSRAVMKDSPLHLYYTPKTYACKEPYITGVLHYSEYQDTRAKLAPLKKQAACYYALFSESGFDDRIHEEKQKDTSLYLYTLHDIVHGVTDR